MEETGASDDKKEADLDAILEIISNTQQPAQPSYAVESEISLPALVGFVKEMGAIVDIIVGMRALYRQNPHPLLPLRFFREHLAIARGISPDKLTQPTSFAQLIKEIKVILEKWDAYVQNKTVKKN